MAHYFDAEPAVGSRPGTVELRLPEGTVTLEVDRGVFSGARVDAGTMALLRAVPDPPTGDLLDLGCGYGPIAVALARRASVGSVVWAIDVNARAVALTSKNAQRLGLDAVRATRPDELPADVRFAAIWSNPPVRIGKAALHGLLERWLPRLRPGGHAWMVVGRHLGADSLADWLSVGGWTVRRAGSKQGYRILDVTAASGDGASV